MALTLTDLLRDLYHDAQINEALDPEMQRDPEIIIDEYRETIIAKLIGI